MSASEPAATIGNFTFYQPDTPPATMRLLCASLMLWLLVCGAAQAASKFDGTWHGTYNGQPEKLMPDGSYPETVNAFELRLKDNRGNISVFRWWVIISWARGARAHRAARSWMVQEPAHVSSK